MDLIETDARRSSNSLRLPAEAVEVQVEETDAQNVIESEDVDEKTMEEAWRMTHTLRQKTLKTNITTLDYMKKFPLLKRPDGFKLVSLKVKTVFQALKHRIMMRNLIINRFSIRFRPKSYVSFRFRLQSLIEFDKT